MLRRDKKRKDYHKTMYISGTPCPMLKFRVFFPRRHSRGFGVGFGVGLLALGLGFGLGLRHKSWLASYLS